MITDHSNQYMTLVAKNIGIGHQFPYAKAHWQDEALKLKIGWYSCQGYQRWDFIPPPPNPLISEHFLASTVAPQA